MFTLIPLLFKVNGTHTSEDMPPKIPFFTGLKANRTPSATTGSLEAALASTSAAKRNQQDDIDFEKKVRTSAC